jgi:deazaflavin-dependent oxidoreductase (nitroreductase family)
MSTRPEQRRGPARHQRAFVSANAELWLEFPASVTLLCMPDFSLFGPEHVKQYEATGGKVGHDWNGTSCLVLRTRGRKSGEVRKNPLIYGRDGDNYVVVASKGGAPEHPGWYLNLLAHPEIEIQVRDRVIPVTARTGTPADKARVWKTMTAQWPDYDAYQQKTTREIPVVILTPR